MKKYFFLLLFLSASLSGFSQYGKLEPLRDNDSTYMVLRTPAETLIKLSESGDKNIRKTGTQIATVERQLNMWRAIFNLNRQPSRDLTYFLVLIKSLEEKGVNVNDYVREALHYSTPPPGRAY